MNLSHVLAVIAAAFLVSTEALTATTESTQGTMANHDAARSIDAVHGAKRFLRSDTDNYHVEDGDNEALEEEERGVNLKPLTEAKMWAMKDNGMTAKAYAKKMGIYNTMKEIERTGRAAFVTPSNAIPGASVIDYIKCFQNSLNCDVNDLSTARRELTEIEGEALQLTLTVKIGMFSLAWEAKYSFVLEPVSVERIEMLEAKLGELEKITGVRNGDADDEDDEDFVDEGSGDSDDDGDDDDDNGEPRFIQLCAMHKYGNMLWWNKVESDGFVATGHDGVLKVCSAGVYSIEAIVNCEPTGHNQEVSLMKNGERVQYVFVLYTGHYSSASLSFVTELEANDELRVTCDCRLVGSSYMAVKRM
ncbi:hypothetical protein PHYBOEH_010732 [Phytophthora boehmeriae]|uniref:RxLR effector protein n=1 Tax=Phytophthora boehmeriae TaxID=109152 RepID=A0A8T1VLP0_9STRA|nr:hypothetical protein PHYBOEH_010732 [Phytophthora boehmeriae]